jgi:hypothetical protein
MVLDQGNYVLCYSQAYNFRVRWDVQIMSFCKSSIFHLSFPVVMYVPGRRKLVCQFDILPRPDPFDDPPGQVHDRNSEAAQPPSDCPSHGIVAAQAFHESGRGSFPNMMVNSLSATRDLHPIVHVPYLHASKATSSKSEWDKRLMHTEL